MREIPYPELQIREIPDPELQMREIPDPVLQIREIEKPEKPIEDPLFTVVCIYEIYCNKRTFSHKKNVQSPKDWR